MTHTGSDLRVSEEVPRPFKDLDFLDEAGYWGWRGSGLFGCFFDFCTDMWKPESQENDLNSFHESILIFIRSIKKIFVH